MKKTANCIHHTHWDLLWYFTAQDAQVQFSYNFKEILDAFDNGDINQFFFDGQTVPIDEYIINNPHEFDRIKKLVSEKKLIIGPFNAQLDCFISSGESVINNLRLGIKTAKELGNFSKIAYLPDSFGHSIDFPKIFNKFGINDFVITRGVGDHYGLDSEFLWESKDGSELKVFTMIAGYGYGCYPFKNRTLFDKGASDYNKIDIKKLIDRVISYSSLKDDFVFLLGFDQNPMMFKIDENIKYYNSIQNDYEFKETTWEEYFKKIEKNRGNLKVHKDELFSTQYHRVHRSMFSTRSDIKTIQDQVERVLTYQVQPMMTMLDYLGVRYDHGLIDATWKKLVFCQTHSSATLTDETNKFIERESINALNLAESTRTFLCKILALSTKDLGGDSTPLFVINTLPFKRSKVSKIRIYTKTPSFTITDNQNNNIEFTVLNSTKKNNGVLRKDVDLIDEDKFYYEHDILCKFENLDGISYKALFVNPSTIFNQINIVSSHDRFIENSFYKIYHDENGINILNKKTNLLVKRAIYIEDGGDEGDSYDYSYPNNDHVLIDYFDEASKDYHVTKFSERLEINGVMKIPNNLKDREHKRVNAKLSYRIKIDLYNADKVIKFKGYINNDSEQHRVRLVFKTLEDNLYSYAGTQYGFIKRDTYQKEMEIWKDDQWFEEPSATYPLLNHVSAVGKNQTTSIFTRSSKEYEFINQGFKDIAITLFRSYGAMGYPDLNRRPGRPSGLDYMIFKTPESQMKFRNSFELGLSYFDNYDANIVTNNYVSFATDIVLYQRQDFDKSYKPIDYFPTNPTNLNLPYYYNFLKLNDFEGSFGSIVKDDESDEYILRIYNNEDISISIPKMKGGVANRTIVDTDLIGNESDKLAKTIEGNELRMIRFKKQKEETI